MARSFDGTNDNLTSAADSLPGLDNDDISFAFSFMKAVQPVGAQTIAVVMTAAAGSARWRMQAVAPTTAGFRFEFFCAFSGGTNGVWTTTNDLALNTPYHLAVTYNRSTTTNDPTIYVNGTSVAITETLTPTGTANTGGDTLRLGESPSGGSDLEGLIQHFCAIGGVIFSADDVNRARWWGRPRGGLHAYYPFVTDKLTNEGSETGATLTATGATVTPLVTPTVRPGSAMLGMGIGW